VLRLRILSFRPLSWPLLLFALAATSGAQVLSPPKAPVILNGGAGAIDITLTNSADSAISLDLKVGSFKDRTSQATLPAPNATFSLAAGNAALPAKIDRQQTLQIEVNISNLTSSGTSQVPLFNGSALLGDLETVALDAPLNISIDGDGTADKPLSFTYGKEVTVTLKNGDAITYPLEWEFRIADRDYKGSATLAPHGSARILFKPECALYSWLDWIHPSSQTGLLLLRLQAPGQITKELLPARTLPVSLLMMRKSANSTAIYSYVYATIFLLIGGVLSLLASSVLPSMLRKAALRGQIRDLADRTSSVSTRVDSYLRVLLRLERKNVDMLLKSVKSFFFFFFPTTVDTLDEGSAATDKLVKRLKIAERLDDLRRELETASETAPPSVIDDADKQLAQAAILLHSFALPDENLAAANVFLDKAKASLGALDNPDALAKLIAEKFKSLKIRVAAFPPQDYADLKKTLSGIFSVLDKPFDDPNEITHEMAFAIDHSIAAIHAVFDYSMVRSSLPAAASSNCAQPGKQSTQRDHECDLLALIGTMSWQALGEARTLVREMRENIYESDVLDEIGKPGQAELVFDTQRARPYLPVYFSIAFKDPKFRTAAAIERLACLWIFPGGLQEHGWKVCHFFSGKETELEDGHEPITATVQSQRALPGSVEPVEKTLSRKIEIQLSKPPAERARVFAETLRFFIAFGVALVALLSGALGQLEKLDIVPATLAIVALGFGADSIKNLLTQPAKKSAGKPA
jgi:hypothetical protein